MVLNSQLPSSWQGFTQPSWMQVCAKMCLLANLPLTKLRSKTKLAGSWMQVCAKMLNSQFTGLWQGVKYQTHC